MFQKRKQHESDDLNRITLKEFTCLPLFDVLVTNKEKRPSHILVNLKKTKFAPAGFQTGSSSRTFNPEATNVGG